MNNEELHRLWIDKGQGMKALESVYQQGRADSCGTIGVTEDGEYIMYNGHLYKKVADRVKGAEE